MSAERFPVEAGHIMLFARAVGDPNPVYHDERAAAAREVGGIIAPPTFVQAGAHFDPDYPLRPAPGVPWFGSGSSDSGAPAPGSGAEGGTSLHAEQHFEYHRPIHPGMVLRAITEPGRTWEKQGRSGRLVFGETITRYVDPAGEAVVTARSVSVRTEGPSR